MTCIVHRPIWIKKREQVDTRQQPNTDRENKRQRYSRGRQNGDRIVNDDLDDQMRLPNNLKFGDVFKQANTGNAPRLNHTDVSQRCHNFHHRGFCWTTCSRKHSHQKKLTKKEKVDGRRYLQDILGRYNAENKKLGVDWTQV